MHISLESAGVCFIGPGEDKKDTYLETSSLLRAFTVLDYAVYATKVK